MIENTYYNDGHYIVMKNEIEPCSFKTKFIYGYDSKDHFELEIPKITDEIDRFGKHYHASVNGKRLHNISFDLYDRIFIPTDGIDIYLKYEDIEIKKTITEKIKNYLKNGNVRLNCKSYYLINTENLFRHVLTFEVQKIIFYINKYVFKDLKMLLF